MIDRSLRRRFAAFLILVGCLGLSLQAEGSLSLMKPIPGTLRCVEASWVTLSAFPADTAGEGTCSDERSSYESLFLLPGPAETSLSQHGSVPAVTPASPAEGFSAEIDHPPIASV